MLVDLLISKLDSIIDSQTKLSAYIDSIDLNSLGFETLSSKDKMKVYLDLISYNKSITDFVIEVLNNKKLLNEQEIVLLYFFNKLSENQKKVLLLKLEDKVNVRKS